jgi:hypothetical protein
VDKGGKVLSESFPRLGACSGGPTAMQTGRVKDVDHGGA